MPGDRGENYSPSDPSHNETTDLHSRVHEDVMAKPGHGGGVNPLRHIMNFWVK